MFFWCSFDFCSTYCVVKKSILEGALLANGFFAWYWLVLHHRYWKRQFQFWNFCFRLKMAPAHWDANIISFFFQLTTILLKCSLPLPYQLFQQHTVFHLRILRLFACLLLLRGSNLHFNVWKMIQKNFQLRYRIGWCEPLKTIFALHQPNVWFYFYSLPGKRKGSCNY